MRYKKCEKCGSPMIKWLVTHKTKFFNKKVTIPNLDGYICTNLDCKHEITKENLEPYIQEQLLYERLHIIEKEQLKPLLISHVKRIRAEKNLTQKQIANVFNVTEQRIGAIERNANIPTITLSYQLADLLGVTSDDLYKLIYVTNDFYNELINLKLVEDEDKYEFEYVKEIEILRKEVSQLRQSIYDLNSEKRTCLQDARYSTEEEKEEYELRIAKIDEKKKEIQLIKDGKGKRGGKEQELTKLETKHNLIVKQGYLIDSDDWEKIEKVYSDRIKEIY